MKKVLKNILKWILLVWISYALIFVGIISSEQLGVVESINYRIKNIDGFSLNTMDEIEIEEICKQMQEIISEEMNNDDEIINAEYLSESEKIEKLKYNELFRKYPSGYIIFIQDVTRWESMTDLQVTSLIIGIAVGTGIYLMLDKDKKGLKFIISLYVIFVILLGFLEGILSVYGESLTLLERWIFPETYIVPITAVFALAIVTRILRQKEIAKRLNEKLKEKKEEKNK